MPLRTFRPKDGEDFHTWLFNARPRHRQRYITIASPRNGSQIHSNSLSSTSSPLCVKKAAMLMGDTSMGRKCTKKR